MKYEYTATKNNKVVKGTICAKNSTAARKKVKEKLGTNCKNLAIVPLMEMV